MAVTNRRIFYACYASGIASFTVNPTTYTTLRGVQSIGINTTFNLEQAFEIGQLSIYQNIENIPDVEVTAEKVLDGYAPIYLSATVGAPAATMIGRSNQRCNLALAYFPDVNATASGGQLAQCVLSGLYVSQYGYNVSVEGNATEQVTLVGNNKVWATGSFIYTGFTSGNGVTSLIPAAPEGVDRRQNLVMASCVWPTDIRGISSSGTNDDIPGSGMFNVSMQSVKVSANLGRDQLLELGRKGAYFRYANFPVEVTTAIEINAHDGDFVAATESGVLAYGNNIADQPIHLVMQEGLVLDMGVHNKLNSVTYGGGNAGKGGGNATITYNYQGWNDFTVQHPADPTTPLRP